ncbi:MAG: phosphoglucomutase/phosphomannomutase family protein, partial [Chloroflexota bacterium]|nr:phosphoglucomutase/phosphomannomutase family protein [Chloroflexota bacterium]
VRACAQSVALYLKETGLAQRGLVVGYDTRFASEDFAAAVAEVAAANGIPVYLCDSPVPTPAVSFTILQKQAGGAVIITASHNPAQWSGFKYKPEYASSASPEVIARLEAPLPRILAAGDVPRLPLAEARERGLVKLVSPRRSYLEHLGELVDLAALRAAGLRVVIDSMYGAAAGWLLELLAGGATQVQELHGERNPLFPGLQPEPIARHLGALIDAVRSTGADVGVATDGDGDRVGVIDERGEFVNQHQVFALLAYYLLEVRGQRGAMVKSVTSTRMIPRLGELYGVPVYETPVGFKFLGPKMIAEDALIAGEESGGFAFRGHPPERDGILSALYFLDFLARRRCRPSELLAELYEKVGPHYYDRIDIHLEPDRQGELRERLARAQPERLAGLAVTASDTTDGFRFHLEGGGWLLFRFSGTEPLLRIYTEVQDQRLVAELLAAGKELAGLP